MTQDELARCAGDLGLRWNASKVADFEAGRASPTFAAVLTASLALDHAVEEAARARGESAVRVTLADLVGSDKWVALNDDLCFRGGDLADVCRGKRWTFSRDVYHRQVRRQAKAAREQILRALGTTEAEQQEQHDRLADVSFRLWRRTFSDERDRRAGPHANKQKRGQVSRTLQAELEKPLADGND